MRRWTGLVLMALLLMAGCGYHYVGNDQGVLAQVDTVAIGLFDNTTRRPFLAPVLAEALRREFSARPGIRVVTSSDQAVDASLEGQIVDYDVSPSVYDADDEIQEYRVSLDVAMQLRSQEDNSILWQEQLSWDDEYRASMSELQGRAAQNAELSIRESIQEQALERICQLLAENAYSRITAAF